MRTIKRLVFGHCFLALGVGIPIGSALAQVAAPLEEIIVTARKRDESLMKVPVIETAISGKQLEKTATNDFHTLVDKVPGVLIGDATGAFGAQLSIRGIGSIVSSTTVDQSVSLNIDGLTMTQAMALTGAMLDVQQVEVLKGPQALFFGKNSPAGVISLRTSDPTDKFDTIVRGGYEFEAKEKRSEAIVSGPLSNTLGARIALSFSDQDGYFRNYAHPSLYNGGVPGGLDPRYRNVALTREYLGRVTFKWAPTDRFNARLKVNHTRKSVQGNGGYFQVSGCPNGSPAGLTLQFNGGASCTLGKNFYVADLDPRYLAVPHGGIPYTDTSQTFGSLELNYDVAQDIKITSVSGAYGLQDKYLFNGTMAAAIPVLAAAAGFEKNDFTQEVRLTSDFTTPLNFMVGGFYEQGVLKNRNRLVGNTALKLPAVLQDGFVHIGIKSYSAFGQLTYAVTPQVILAGGARWTHEARDRSAFGLIDLLFAKPPFFGPGQVSSAVPRIAASNTSPEVTVTWLPTDDLTVFAAYKQGFKSGSFNSDGLESDDQSFRGERVTGSEAGIKSRFLDRTLSLNVSGYRYHYSDLQVASLVAGGGGISLRTLNAASADVHGVEGDLAYEPSVLTGLTLRSSANWNHGRFGSFNTAPCYGGQTIAAGCNGTFNPATGRYTTQDLSGKPLVRAPDWAWNAGFDYETPLSAGGVVLGFGATITYSGKFLTDISAIPGNEQNSYFKTDVYSSLHSDNNAWEVSLVANNVADKLTTGSCADGNYNNGVFLGGQVTGSTTSGPAGVSEIGCFMDRGRQVWLRFEVRPTAFFTRN